MSDYSYPYKDAKFIISELCGFDHFCEQAGLVDVNSELVEAILEEATGARHPAAKGRRGRGGGGGGGGGGG